MDSLVAVEMKNWLFKAVMVDLSVSDIMKAPSMRSLGERYTGHVWQNWRSGHRKSPMRDILVTRVKEG